jgi:hypothetical protein
MAGRDHYHVNPQRAVDRLTLITGIGYSVAKTKTQLNRQMRQEGLRDFLSKQKLIEKAKAN